MKLIRNDLLAVCKTLPASNILRADMTHRLHIIPTMVFAIGDILRAEGQQ